MSGGGLVEISNFGNLPTGAISIELSGEAPNSFLLSMTSIANIEAGESVRFEVVPRAGLSVGVHKATVMVSGANVVSNTYEVSFTVNAPQTAYEIIQFGGYNWIVLDVDEENGRRLLLSERIIETGREYRSPSRTTTWSDSDMRRYLNSEFLNRFNASDRERIASVVNTTPSNPSYSNSIGGGNTVDSVFLLSFDEILRYFGGGQQFGATGSVNDQFNSLRVAYDMYGFSHSWWTRTPGNSNTWVTFVGEDGRVDSFGTGVTNIALGVRPAMWVSLSVGTVAVCGVNGFRCAVSTCAICNSPGSVEKVEIDLVWHGITNAQLSSMVANGAIPQNVTSLNLLNNQISDISPLAELTNLEWLNLGGNQISDISPLVGLVNLEQLFIHRNQISTEQRALLQTALPNTRIHWDI
jgi:hypothetical protein